AFPTRRASDLQVQASSQSVFHVQITRQYFQGHHSNVYKYTKKQNLLPNRVIRAAQLQSNGINQNQLESHAHSLLSSIFSYQEFVHYATVLLEGQSKQLHPSTMQLLFPYVTSVHPHVLLLSQENDYSLLNPKATSTHKYHLDGLGYPPKSSSVCLPVDKMCSTISAN